MLPKDPPSPKTKRAKSEKAPRLATPLLLQEFVEADRAPVRGWNDIFDFEGQEVRQIRQYPGGWRQVAEEKCRAQNHEARLDKSRMLRTHLAMESHRALPSDGIPLEQVVDLPLTKLAEASGYAVTINVSAKGVKSVSVSGYARALRRCPSIIETKRAYGSPSHREWGFAQSTRTRGKAKIWDGMNMPSGRELAGHPVFSKFFRGSTGNGGYHQRMGFIHHPKFPGRPNDKVLLSVMCRHGIFMGGQVLEKTTQKALSIDSGLCVDTVRSIQRKFSIYTRRVKERDPVTGKLRTKKELDPETGKLKPVRIEERGAFPMFRIVPQPGCFWKDGQRLEAWEPGAKFTQPPNKIVYLGDRMLDARTAVIETRRLQEIAETHQTRQELWWQYVARVHSTLLRDWVGTERHVTTFWQACRMQLIDGGYGVPGWAMDLLFPEWRPPN